MNFKAKHDVTPIHVAAKWGRTQMCWLLLKYGAIIDCKTKDFLTPLHCASRSGHDQVGVLSASRIYA